MKISQTVIAWIVTVLLAGLITALVLANKPVPVELSLAFTVALGAATGLSVPTGLAVTQSSPVDLISEIRGLLNDVNASTSSSPATTATVPGLPPAGAAPAAAPAAAPPAPPAVLGSVQAT